MLLVEFTLIAFTGEYGPAEIIMKKQFRGFTI